MGLLNWQHHCRGSEGITTHAQSQSEESDDPRQDKERLKENYRKQETNEPNHPREPPNHPPPLQSNWAEFVFFPLTAVLRYILRYIRASCKFLAKMFFVELFNKLLVGQEGWGLSIKINKLIEVEGRIQYTSFLIHIPLNFIFLKNPSKDSLKI